MRTHCSLSSTHRPALCPIDICRRATAARPATHLHCLEPTSCTAVWRPSACLRPSRQPLAARRHVGGHSGARWWCRQQHQRAAAAAALTSRGANFRQQCWLRCWQASHQPRRPQGELAAVQQSATCLLFLCASGAENSAQGCCGLEAQRQALRRPAAPPAPHICMHACGSAVCLPDLPAASRRRSSGRRFPRRSMQSCVSARLPACRPACLPAGWFSRGLGTLL